MRDSTSQLRFEFASPQGLSLKIVHGRAGDRCSYRKAEVCCCARGDGTPVARGIFTCPDSRILRHHW